MKKLLILFVIFDTVVCFKAYPYREISFIECSRYLPLRLVSIKSISLFQQQIRVLKPTQSFHCSSSNKPIEDEIIRIDVSTESVQFDHLEWLKEDVFRLIKTALFREKALAETEISIVICSDEHIRSLNRDWRNKDVVTDVLSFPQDDDEVVLGDLVISLPTAKRQAEEREHTLRDELRILILHGFLHLLGYDHETSREDMIEMAGLESKLLQELNWAGCGLIEAANI